MKNPNIKTKVVHSKTKKAWNVVGEKYMSKYKIARVPYLGINDEIADKKFKKEAYEHAEYISYCFNNSDQILKQ